MLDTDGIESKCPETIKTVFANFSSVPGRIAYTFCIGAGLPRVRSPVASNLSTTIWSLPPLALLISLGRSTILSRPQPGPRFGSSQLQIEMRVPHATIESISARMDFSSTEERAIAPLGRGIVLAFGRGCGGSAGSFIADRCAACAAAGWSCAAAPNTEIKSRQPIEHQIRSMFIFSIRVL